MNAINSVKKICVVVFIIVGFSANAQSKFKIGAAGGANIANFSNQNSSGFSSVLGLNSGLIFEVKLPVIIGFEADFLYSMKGSSLKFASFDQVITSEYSLRYIDIPVVVKIYLFKVTNIQLGLQYSHLLEANLDIDEFTWDVKDLFDFADLSVVLGLGIDANRLHFSARYNYGVLGGFSGGVTKINMLTFSVGIWIKK
jgi:hypothetical protein